MSLNLPDSNLTKLHSLFESLLHVIDPVIASILDKAIDGKEISVEEGVELFEAKGIEMNTLMLVADELRRQKVGNIVTYIINRNINFTNICIKRCGFCAFSRGYRDEEGYFLPIKEVVHRTKEAWELGATEVCIQAGLPPRMDGYLYINVCKAIKKELPDIHIHAFSPEEIAYGALRLETTVEDYLKMLKEAGIGSLPGTSAEILDDEIRRIISPGRIRTKDWINVIKTAHKLGIPTTSTIMYGHIENSLHKARHIAIIRDIQKETNGITEFVPLSFVHSEAPMYKKGLVRGVRPGATGAEVVKMHAVSRIMLNNYMKNIQVSWVKEGTKLSQFCLNAGANDLGGTLIDESISRSAGAIHGQLLRPKDFRRLIRDIGRIPAQRSTTYDILRIFNDEKSEDMLDKFQLDESKLSSIKI
ncbi:MAG: 5-amino-6-(D-ribitylamino)uracil--L-tyrosine 4-hydroxyphenyl transferase CofH [archaeon]|nr:5-amino-6-(D-ribitylamino)uracil--L-tyrosine 4-hydroxyphenyl transferase CofH [archaeon]MCP8313623.1 5-amino-6-(D-ribitylamino)uracil--L-tyrosine 4-hydroxyphenyl transferase CofH [archaeon]